MKVNWLTARKSWAFLWSRVSHSLTACVGFLKVLLFPATLKHVPYIWIRHLDIGKICTFYHIFMGYVLLLSLLLQYLQLQPQGVSHFLNSLLKAPFKLLSYPIIQTCACTSFVSCEIENTVCLPRPSTLLAYFSVATSKDAILHS